MSTTPVNLGEPTTNMDDLQQALKGIAEVGQAGASPFIKSESGKATEAKVAAEVNLGIAALPLLGNLFHALGNLFHHAHKQSQK